MGWASLSRPARWRIVTLAAVHVLIAVHIVHWRLAGVSLASVQLSDAGRLAAEGVATAALFFLAFLVVVTLLFGRVFCGWGCHMLALQEVCRWLLGKCGIRPKLLPSRALRLVPFAVALYVFAAPALQRWWFGMPFPHARVELTSAHLWAHLPGPYDAVAAVVIGGVAMVYLLGRLSFCKYICPYGAVFALADGVSLARIRLCGDCDGCARCTAACTTGVRVHAEVLRHGVVANAGCMRCLECVSACPRGVLRYRFGRPALGVPDRRGLTAYVFSWGEEALLGAVFLLSFVSLNGLYGRVPMFVALALSVVCAYGGVVVARLATQPHVHVRGVVLKRDGRLLARAGVVLATASVAALLLLHSAGVQYEAVRAGAELAQLGFPRVPASVSVGDAAVARAAAARLERCARYGIVSVPDWQMELAWVYRVLNDGGAVESHLRHAIALQPGLAPAHFNLARELWRQQRHAEAADAYRSAVRLDPDLTPYVPAGVLDAAANEAPTRPPLLPQLEMGRG